ncbi:unnamed protein product [Didymodactylos carnosus]|uniref:Flavodoxin-like domain-containing protein n=1 Tax=Didymodactylos carnosus TaxID=1234261 RepID=A0A815BM05_9BILA|nr:unnamed protein product [Didymodactylos carnosus]CAF1336945.1 unnamed protein product [Didymodactylos carnosus]CAF4059725.1 unnamed protein product [Didymodactylos carnosus]CAF4148240.1 unnamed protein product [Didymodactylos carnosus]
MSNPKPGAKIHIIYYSMYGHIAQMAKQVLKGVEAAGAQGFLFQIPETLPQDVLDKMHAPKKDDKVPVVTYDKLDDILVNCDGIIFGYPTRYGGMCGQMKTFWDQTGGLWMKGALMSKPFSIFFSTSTQGGGQETTALTSLSNFVHHGMIYVPIGYSSPKLADMNEIHGGSAYGAGTLSGPDGSRQPSALELEVAEHSGKHLTEIAMALKIGRDALPKKEASPPNPEQKSVPPEPSRSRQSSANLKAKENK